MDIKVRRAQTGSLLVEILGEDAGSKANSLAARLGSLFSSRKGVKIIRPIRRTELHLLDLDDFVTAKEIAEAVAQRGQIQTGDVRVGPLRPGRGGLNTAWVQCSETCVDLLQKDGGLRIGWSRVRIVPLTKRRLQCYRCFAIVHTRVNCRSATDRSRGCFNCGKEGHTAVVCRLTVRCVQQGTLRLNIEPEEKDASLIIAQCELWLPWTRMMFTTTVGNRALPFPHLGMFPLRRREWR